VLDHARSCPVHSPFSLPEGVLPPTMIDAPWGTQPGISCGKPWSHSAEAGAICAKFLLVPATTHGMSHPPRTWPTVPTSARPPEPDSTLPTYGVGGHLRPVRSGISRVATDRVLLTR